MGERKHVYRTNADDDKLSRRHRRNCGKHCGNSHTVVGAAAGAHRGGQAARRQILQSYLSEAGYVIETAANGIEALEKAKLWKPDVITLDILLPVKDGWQVLRELKQHPLCKDIPVIIISMLDERNVGFGLGAVDYFVKPVQKDELLESLRKVTSGLKQKQSARILGDRRRPFRDRPGCK